MRRFRRSRRGSTAVEFALVAPMFFALLFAILETAMVFFAGQVLETMAQDGARMIMTGQAQTAKYQQADFQSYVCNQIPILFSCANLSIDVKSYPAFSNVVLSSQIDSGGCFDPTGIGYNPGGPSQIVVVRLFYQWPMIVTGLGYNISSLCGGSKRLLTAAAAFQTEPY
ncbi:Flp pilus assembly protein TadG [Bradyrhizobium lablabi]|uniref:Flp pilus assembly protein TadG n=1 Tax=Bradyrhizobium lablabi TaxID=722472 RepID=A0A1M6RA13_9BRAD|nr:Flp pilus assembly protein TadG [Bradyrhizobium lablabi]